MGVADFLISYTAADEEWAEWVAFILVEQKCSVRLQKWDFAAGSNFVLEMQGERIFVHHPYFVAGLFELEIRKAGMGGGVR